MIDSSILSTLIFEGLETGGGLGLGPPPGFWIGGRGGAFMVEEVYK